MNIVCLSGRVATDIVVRQGEQREFARFLLAVDRDDAGQPEKTDFINVMIFHKQAQLIKKHCKKGGRVELVGRWQTGQLTLKNGTTVRSDYLSVAKIRIIDWYDEIKQGDKAKELAPILPPEDEEKIRKEVDIDHDPDLPKFKL